MFSNVFLIVCFWRVNSSNLHVNSYDTNVLLLILCKESSHSPFLFLYKQSICSSSAQKRSRSAIAKKWKLHLRFLGIITVTAEEKIAKYLSKHLSEALHSRVHEHNPPSTSAVDPIPGTNFKNKTTKHN